MKTDAPVRTEGCPIQTNATCVTGQRLAHALRRSSGRVTTQRSAVVTRPHSVSKCEWCGKFFITRPNSSRIMASLLNKKCVFSHDTAVRPVYTGCTFWFYPRPLRQSGAQGTSGSCNRCIGESCDPFSTSGGIEAVHLQNQDGHSAVPSNRHSLSQPRAVCPAMAYGRCCAVLIFNQPQACPAYFKGGVTTLKNRPRAGSLDRVEPVLNGEHATLPLTRHCQVVLGVVPHDCFAQANLPAPAVRWSETLT